MTNTIKISTLITSLGIGENITKGGYMKLHNILTTVAIATIILWSHAHASELTKFGQKQHVGINHSQQKEFHEKHDSEQADTLRQQFNSNTPLNGGIMGVQNIILDYLLRTDPYGLTHILFAGHNAIAQSKLLGSQDKATSLAYAMKTNFNTESVYCSSFKNQPLVALRDPERNILLWNWKKKNVEEIQKSDDSRTCKFSSQGTHVAYSSGSIAEITLFDLHTKKRKKLTVLTSEAPFTHIRFTPDDAFLVAINQNKQIYIWRLNLQSRIQAELLPGYPLALTNPKDRTTIKDISISQHKALAVIFQKGYRHGKVMIWKNNLFHDKTAPINLELTGNAESVQFSPDGNELAIGMQNGSIHTYDITGDPRCKDVSQIFSTPIQDFEFLPDKIITVASLNQSIPQQEVAILHKNQRFPVLSKINQGTAKPYTTDINCIGSQGHFIVTTIPDTTDTSTVKIHENQPYDIECRNKAPIAIMEQPTPPAPWWQRLINTIH